MKHSAILVWIGGVGALTALFGCGSDGMDDPMMEAVESELRPTASDSEYSQSELKPTAPDSEYLRIPGGIKVHRDCVYEATSTRAFRAEDYPECKYASKRDVKPSAGDPEVADQDSRDSVLTPPTVNGWVAHTYELAGAAPYWYGSVQSSWTVPANPTMNGALVYYFPGLENTSGTTTIIQPVLQWGNNGAFGGNYWTYASWYVGGGNGIYSPPLNASAGEVIVGSMVASNCDGYGRCTWAITTTNNTRGLWTSLQVAPGVTYNWAAPGALEAYNLTSCDQYPNQNYVTIWANLFVGSTHTPYTSSWAGVAPGGTPYCNYAVGAGPNPGATYLYAY